MYKTPAILSVAILLFTGCSSGLKNIPAVSKDTDAVSVTNQTETAQAATAQATTTEAATDESLAGILAGATYVSIDPLNSDRTPINTPPTTSRTLSFTSTAVTHNKIDGNTVGSFSNVNDSEWIANFASGSVKFRADADTIVWDGVTYQRVATSQFNSQQSLIRYFNGSTYTTLGQFDVGENAFGQRALGQWSVQFADDQIVWSVQDTVSVGRYSFIDGSSFTIEAPFDELTAFVLNDDQLVIDSIVYQKEAGNLPDSNRTLTASLNALGY